MLAKRTIYCDKYVSNMCLNKVCYAEKVKFSFSAMNEENSSPLMAYWCTYSGELLTNLASNIG